MSTFDELRKLEKNWDSYNADPIDPATIDRAEEFLKRAHVLGTSKGGVQIEWHTHGIDLEVEFLPDGRSLVFLVVEK